MRIITASEYTRLERPALSWIVEGFLPQPSLTILLGEPFAGKSFLALQLGFRIARGEKALGAKTKQGTVLYFQFDTSEFVWRDRLQKLQLAGEITTGPLYLIHPADNPTSCNIMDPLTERKIRDAIAQASPCLIIFDVMRELHNRKEDSSTDMKLVGDKIMDLTKGYATMILHHTTKISNKDNIRVIDLSRGSSYLTGKADSVWCIIDNYLHIVPRFAERSIQEGYRDATGYWTFPLLDKKDELNALCLLHPRLTHKEIGQEEAPRLKLSARAIKGYLDSQSCAHSSTQR